jgi:hypothetical protein
MSITSAVPRRSAQVPVPGGTSGAAGRLPAEVRVRHQARDAAALMAFSAAVSLGVAVAFLLLAVAARQA